MCEAVLDTGATNSIVASSLVSDPNLRGYCQSSREMGTTRTVKEKNPWMCAWAILIVRMFGHEFHPSKRQDDSGFDFYSIETHCQKSRD